MSPTRHGRRPPFSCAPPPKNKAHMLVPARRVKAPVAFGNRQLQAAARALADGRGGGTGSHAVTLTRASQQRPPTTPASHPPVPLAVSAPSAAGWWMERAAAEGRSRCSACDSVRGRVVLGRASCVRVGVHEPMQNVSCVALSTRAARARAICVGFHGRA